MDHLFFIAISLLAIIGQHVSVQTKETSSEQNSSREYISELNVTNGAIWGYWMNKSMCPDGTYAAGFSLRVKDLINGDNTALNGIHLYCTDRSEQLLSSNDITSIASGIGYWGERTVVKYCPSGFFTAFKLRVESPQGSGDNTAANNIRFLCSGGAVLEGDGTFWGEWGDWSPKCDKRGICGLMTKIEEPQGNEDDTALNDVVMYCCD